MRPVRISARNIMFTEPMEGYNSLNIGLIIGNEYNYVIDTGLGSGSAAPVFDYLSGDKKPVVVINTHSHWDHVWGNWMFGDSLIISHTECRELIDRNWDEDIVNFYSYIDGEARKRLPNLVFDDILSFPNDGVEIFHTPGHTADSVSVYDSVGKVLYAGDNVGDTDGDIVPEIETSIEIYKNTIELYKKYDFDICVSGHNQPKGRELISAIESRL